MYVVWSHVDDKPVRLDKIVLFASWDDAFESLVHNADHIGCDLVGDWYSIEHTETIHDKVEGRPRTYGEAIRDYYIGAI